MTDTPTITLSLKEANDLIMVWQFLQRVATVQSAGAVKYAVEHASMRLHGESALSYIEPIIARIQSDQAKQQGNGMPGEVPVVERMIIGWIDKAKSVQVKDLYAVPRCEAAEYAEVPVWALRQLLEKVRSPAPVTVSLEKCANAAAALWTNWETFQKRTPTPRELTKAVLESVKEQGAKFDYADR